MKLRSIFLTHEADGEQVMVATDTKQFSGLVRSNRTAAEIVNCLKTETTQEQIIQYMLEKYDAGEQQIKEDVERILDILRRIGALDE